MTSFDYDLESLIASFERAGVEPGSTIMVHVSLGRLGRLKDAHSVDDMIRTLYIGLKRILGPAGNLFIPTYTYSIGKNQIFDVQKTPSAVGAFTEFFRTQEQTLRSRDPMLSVAGQGPGVRDLFSDLPRTCFGVDSLYDRLRSMNAMICTLGVGLFWATYRHHIEEMANVPFRFKKKFKGIIRDQGTETTEEWIYFAAPFIKNCEPNGIALEKIIRDKNGCMAVPIGRSELVAIRAQDYFKMGTEELKKNPWLTAFGPPVSEHEMSLKRDSP